MQRVVYRVFAFSLMLLCCGAQAISAGIPSKARLIVLADMGNEPDEEQPTAHMRTFAALQYGDRATTVLGIQVKGNRARAQT